MPAKKTVKSGAETGLSSDWSLTSIDTDFDWSAPLGEKSLELQTGDIVQGLGKNA